MSSAPAKNVSENLLKRGEQPKRGGQAHFAPKTPQNEPVPSGFRIGCKLGRNPFSTACVRPGALPFLFPDGMTATHLIERLSKSGWQGQIVGPHGSGKTTLLHSLLPRLREHRRVEWFTLNSNQRRLPLSRRDRIRWDNSVAVVVDGYEQLSRWQRLSLRLHCKRRGVGLLATSHSDVGLATIHSTKTSCETTMQLVRVLLSNSELYLVQNRVHEIFQRCQGNVRETLFNLYDLYESQQLNRLRS